MFATLQQRIILAVFVFIILAIPIGTYFYSEQISSKEAEDSEAAVVNTQASATPQTITKEPPKPSKSPSKTLKESDASSSAGVAQPSATPTSAISFGPTLNASINIEGRPKTYQAAKVFLGIAQGAKVVKPAYLLIFNVDFPGTGIFEGLSLAGLTVGETYTAYLKGPAQIDSAATFVMGPSINRLNNGTVMNLLTGDLNEDNVVNSADFSIASSSFGANENSSNWNANIDFNRDGLINSIDISIIVKNFGKAGDSGPVTSTPGTASSSASIRAPLGGPEEASPAVMPSNPPGQSKGYWMWVPQL